MSRPYLTRAFIVAALSLIVAALAHFGVSVPADVKNNLVEVLAIVGPLAVGWWLSRHHAANAPAPNEDGSRPFDEAETPADQDVTDGTAAPSSEDTPAPAPYAAE